MICLAFFMTPAGLLRSQDINAGKLEEILTKIKTARSELIFDGVMAIRYEGAKKRESLYQIWGQPPSIYHVRPIESHRRDKDGVHVKNRRRSSSAKLRGSHGEFALFPHKRYLNLFAQNYAFDLREGEAVAGRQSTLLTITPHNPPRFGMRIWYDQRNYFILKREIVYFGEGYEAVSFSQKFKEVNFVAALPDSIVALAKKREGDREKRKRPDRNVFTTVDDLVNDAGVSAFVPGFVPKGCELAAIVYRDENTRKIVHLHYTDGLLNFSIFEILGPPPEWAEKYLHQSENKSYKYHDFQQMVAERNGDYLFLLMGNFEHQELRKIANSLRPFNK